jgi:release factor glutamine methyltransferase
VNPNVLIPRPETEELVAWIGYSHSSDAVNVIDIGTGSGAIALALKERNADWNVHAVDVSKDALEVAKQNAANLEVSVYFHHLNILNDPLPEVKWDILVSNPPYIPERERSTLSTQVVAHEPALALFVSDDDDLIFYRRIIIEGKRTETRAIYFEIHEGRAEGVMNLFEEYGYEPELKLDLQKKPRMVRGFLKD